ETVEEDRAERVQVRPEVAGRWVVELFRRQVGARLGRDLPARPRSLAGACESEVEEGEVALGGDKKVRRLEETVPQAEPVCRGEGSRGLANQVAGDRWIDRATPRDVLLPVLARQPA